MAWDFMMGILYEITYWVDPYIFAFLFLPLEDTTINMFQRSLTLLIIIDMIL